jgi:OOP family OmpA-OmpF porin
MSIRTPVTLLAALALAGLAAGAVPTTAHAQFGHRLKDAIKHTAENKAIDKTTEAENKAIDDAMKGSPDSAGSAAADTGAAASGATAGARASGAAPGPAAAAGGAAPDQLKPGEGAWANYDFKPGDRILYASDFSGDEVGDFPKSLEFKGGGIETVEWQGSRWLRAGVGSDFYIVLPEILPDRFTLEFDYSMSPGGEVSIYPGDDQQRRVAFGADGTASLRNDIAGITGLGKIDNGKPDVLRRARVMADGKYVKVYLDDTRVMNVPNADLGRSKKIRFSTTLISERSLFGNFRVAAGGKKLYDALAAKGRVATQGIYFDTGSDRIRPESTPTLTEIGAMLRDHPDLKLTIEGHTDDVGAAAANQALSEKRAAAVRQFLIDSYQVDGGRLAAKGLGATKPAASNATPEGRQQNRRVELVKM